MSNYEVVVIGKGKALYFTKELALLRLNYFKNLGYNAYMFREGKIPDFYKGIPLHLDKYKEIGDKIELEQHNKFIKSLISV